MFFPTLELICDPDFINQRILLILGRRESVRNSLNNKFAHAATYEDFIKLIKASNNVDELKQLHFKIMNEIMQATIISEFKASSSSKLSSSSFRHHNNHLSSASTPNFNSGVVTCGSSSFFASFSTPDDDVAAVIGSSQTTSPGTNTTGGFFLSNKSGGGASSGEKNSGAGLSSSSSSAKGDSMRSRNLKVYIKQLRYAKLLCERRMNRLSNSSGLHKTPSSMFYDEDTNDLSFENKLKNRKVKSRIFALFVLFKLVYNLFDKANVHFVIRIC